MKKIKLKKIMSVFLISIMATQITGCKSYDDWEVVKNYKESYGVKNKLKDIRVDVIKKERIDEEDDNGKTIKSKYNITFGYEDYKETINDSKLYHLLDKGDKVNATLYVRKTSEGKILKTYFELNTNSW